jgi:hypothetical protein
VVAGKVGAVLLLALMSIVVVWVATTLLFGASWGPTPLVLAMAVASVLAFVFSLKRGERPAPPQVDVPVLLRFDTEGRLDPRAAN